MERRLDMQSVLRSRGYSKVIDLSAAEQDGKSFEGTGVLVLDRINGIAYVALSERADVDVASHWVEKLGYKVYDTFVVMPWNSIAFHFQLAGLKPSSVPAHLLRLRN